MHEHLVEADEPDLGGRHRHPGDRRHPLPRAGLPPCGGELVELLRQPGPPVGRQVRGVGLGAPGALGLLRGPAERERQADEVVEQRGDVHVGARRRPAQLVVADAGHDAGDLGGLRAEVGSRRLHAGEDRRAVPNSSR